MTNMVDGRSTCAVVDLDAIRGNVAAMQSALNKNTALCAVVKADAYGHGSVPVARAALEAGARALAVAMAEEAVPLRDAGITCPILVIGPSNARQTHLGVRLGLDLCVFTVDAVRDLEEAASVVGKTGRMHLKLDTGMNRIGVKTAEELSDVLRELEHCRKVELAGLFTHLSRADEYDNAAPSLEQYERFMDAADQVRVRGHRPMLHVSNSAGAQNFPDLDLDMVRFGISLYGYPAGEGSAKRKLPLKPAMQVLAEVSAVRSLPAGTPIGYGGTFVTQKPSEIATVQIGYGDGYNRLLSNRGRMLVTDHGSAYPAPVVGRVCMDMTMIDVTGLGGVAPGDQVIAMGSALDEHFDAQDIARVCETISYEILCAYTSRVPRIYTEKTTELQFGF